MIPVNKTLLLVLLATTAAWSQAPVLINEIRIDEPGTDTNEYIELRGTPGFSLDGLSYIVIGDGSSGSGVVEHVTDLTGQAINAAGYFVIAEPTFTLGAADLVTTLNFENSDNVTHLLVQGLQVALGDDVDMDDNCVIDFPIGLEFDRIALIEEPNPPTGTECHYGPPTVGPDGTFVPGHVHRCPDGTGSFVIADFDPAAGTDTPGGPNACVPNPGLCAFGFTHVATGQATLSPSSSGSSGLTISNIGASGDDGVDIEIGEPICDRLLGTIQLPPTPPQGPCTASAFGVVSGQPNQLAAQLIAEPLPGSPFMMISPNFNPIGSPTAEVQLLLGDQIVFEATGQTGGCQIIPPPSCTGNCGPQPSDPCPQILVGFPFPIDVQIPTGQTFLADRIRFKPENPMLTLEALQRVELRAVNLPEITIIDEALGVFAPLWLHRTLGDDTKLEANIDHLTLSNIGASGDDGVSIEVEEPDEATSFTIMPPPPPVPPGSTCFATAIGTLAGVPDVPLIHLTGIGTTDDRVEITPDFSPIGASSYRLRVFDDNGLVATLPGLVGPGCILPPPPICTGGCGPGPFGPQIFTDFPNGPIPCELPTGETVLGTRLVFDPELPTLPPVGGVDRILLQTDLPQFTILEELLLPPIPDSLCAFGFEHQALGLAQLELEADDRLVISNIGSSGRLDGVSIDLGDPICDRIEGSIELPPVMPPGGTCLATGFGVVDGVSNTVFSTLQANSLSGPLGQVQLVPDFSPVGAMTHQVQLLLGGSVVFDQGGLSGPGCIFPPPPICSGGCGPIPGDPIPQLELNFPGGPIPVTIPGGPTLDADTIRIIPENPTATVEGIQRVELQTTLPQFTIIDEALGLFAPLFLHRNLGDTKLEATSNNHLVISNIGASGDDGVEIDLGESNDFFSTTILPPPPSPLPPGSGCVATAFGQLSSTPDIQPVSFLHADVVGPQQLQLTPDFSPLGAQTFTLRLMAGGTNLVMLPGISGPGCIIPPPPPGGCTGGCGPTPIGPQILLQFPDPIVCELPGGEVFTADTIIFDGESPTIPLDFVSHIHLQGNGLPFFTIVDEFIGNPIPLLCPSVLYICTYDPAVGVVNLTNIGGGGYTELQIFRNGMLIDIVAGDLSAYTDPNPGTGNVLYEIVGICPNGMASPPTKCRVNIPGGLQEFIRGDANTDASVNLADGIKILNTLFQGDTFACEIALDTNRDCSVNIADAIYLLNFLFVGGPPPTAPFPDCGLRTGCDLSCDSFPPCP